MAKLPIPENCSAYVPMILKEFCSSTKINGLVMKTFSFCESYAPLNLNFPEYTSEAACQHNSSETTEQNIMNLGPPKWGET
jgi:hypothetical protein